MDALLMIFVKNAQAGKVKTRLAATKGQDFALDVYLKLLKHTLQVAAKAGVNTAIYYSDFIEPGDQEMYPFIKQFVQQGNDLGERMANAFKQALQHHQVVLVIGSDCPGITEHIIQEAIQLLHQKDIVIGPAHDGGYYLLGLKQYHQELFFNKSWSSPLLLQQTEATIDHLGLSYGKLPTLSDVDDEKDLTEFNKYIK